MGFVGQILIKLRTSSILPNFSPPPPPPPPPQKKKKKKKKKRELLPFQVFFSCLCAVLLGVTYANMLVTTEECTPPHLTCLGLCGMEL